MNPESQKLDQARLLLRLRELRHSQAEDEARRAQDAHAQALAAVRATQARLSEEQGERRSLLQQIAESSVSLRWAAQAQARRDLIEERLERAEYDLIDDEEALHGADRRLDQAAAALRRASARSDAARDSVQQARRQAAAASERRAEREDPVCAAAPRFAPASSAFSSITSLTSPALPTGAPR